MMVRKTQLENGIWVITERMPSARSIAIGVLVDVSPHDEPSAKMGLAHLTEHSMFQGTSSRDARQIAMLMDMAGGQIGAFTTRDYTCYYATVLDDYRTYALDLLGDILLNSIFPEDSLEREKEAIVNEIEMANDSPTERLNETLKAFAWPDQPLGRSVAGSPALVRTLTREDVIYFVHENYLPDRMTIVAAGHVEHEDFVAQVRDAFWRLMGQSVRQPPHVHTFQSGVVVAHMPVSQAYFSIGLRALPYAHPNRYGLHVLNDILGGGISSRLFHRIREERGLVYNIGSEYHAYRADGLWVIEGSTAPEYLLPVLGTVMVELWKLITGTEAPDDEELRRAKMHIGSQHLLSGENTHTRMSRLATQEHYFGRSISSQEISRKVNAVSHKTLQKLAEDILYPSLLQPIIAVVGPEAPENYNQASIEALISDFQ